MTEKSNTVLSELRGKLEARYGDRLARLVLFGSQARGDAEAGSDIDVLVVLRGNVAPVEEIEKAGALATDLSLRYDTLLSLAFVFEDRYQAEHSPFLMNVPREGVPM